MAYLPQFVRKLFILELSEEFHALMPSLQLNRDQTCTWFDSKDKVMKFITNCIDCKNHRKFEIYKSNTVCNKLFVGMCTSNFFQKFKFEKFITNWAVTAVPAHNFIFRFFQSSR